jgi:hypothetical protein
MPGTGKTFLMGQTARGCSRVVLFDTADAYGPGERTTAVPGFLTATQPEQLFRYFTARDRGGRRLGDLPFQILYKPDRLIEKHFECVCEMLMRVRDVVLVVDEVWHFCKPSWVPEHLKVILLRGRTPGVTLLWAAQRASVTATTLRSCSTELRVFRQVEASDLEALRGRVPPQALALVPSLPDRHFLSVDLAQTWRVCTSDANGRISVLQNG